METDYVNLTADEMARDPFFRKWVLQPSLSMNHFWQSFLDLNPTQRKKVQFARELVILAHRVSDSQLHPSRKNEIHRQLVARIEQSRKRKIKIRMLFSAAAVALLLITILASNMIGGHRSGNGLIYTAAYGEREKISLPDGSTVELNANSSLKLGNDWDQGVREVWLQGEAFFEVEKKLSESGKFIVHTNGPDVEVLGTHFYVDSRQQETRIYLEEGKVCLILKENTDVKKEILLDPGELAFFTGNDFHISKQTSEQAMSLVSWKMGYLVYENASLSEVIVDIEGTYGKRVVLHDEKLLSRKINGAIPSNNLDEFIRVAELLFGVHAKIEEYQIILEND